jgi:hypothetical protein
LKKLILLLAILIVGFVVAEQPMYFVNIVTGDVTLPTGLDRAYRVILTPDSNAADSSYGTVETGSFILGGHGAAVAYVHLYAVKHNNTTDTNFPGDTLILKTYTECQRGHGLHKIQLDSALLTDTTTKNYWLGKGDGFTGSDSLACEIYFTLEMWDSTSDSANHGVTHDYYFDIGVQSKR